ncbi:MAG TPA: aldose epimerase family protein [Acidobacteriaceae bacterium]|nr:aldose epimerase family protein [Acidobacteriaceae bacterium]
MKNRSIGWGSLKYVSLLFAVLATGMRMEAKVTESVFGKMPDGTNIQIYTIEDGLLKARIMTYGARVVSLEVPDRNGKVADVVLGYDTFLPYTKLPKTFFGAIVGRYANRIAHGAFPLDGKQYHIVKSEGDNTLHGGMVGFDSHVWQGHIVPNGVEFTLVSPDGDQGFPGKLTARVRYTLEHNALTIDYSATTDKDTVVNLSNHSYFNLAGEGQGDILGNLLTIHADRYTPVDSTLIPTGQLAPVASTPFDFRHETEIGARIHQNNEQLKLGNGYDHNWVLDGKAGELREAARVYEPKSGRLLTVQTTQPGLQFYTGNFLDGTAHGKHGHVYQKHAALCLETQHYPDSPNHPSFPSTELKPGQTYHNVTVFTFSTRK